MTEKFILRFFLRSKLILRFFLRSKLILRFFLRSKLILRFNFQGITVLYSIGKRYILAVQRAAETQPETGALVILANTNPYQGMDYLKKRWPRLHYVRFKSVEEAQELETAIRQQLY